MAGFNVGNIQRVAGQATGPVASRDARTLLKEYSGHIRETNGEVKPGVLRLVTGTQGEAKLYRDRAFHLRGRGGNDSIRQAGELTKNLFQKAYENRLTPAAFSKLMSGLTGYLEARGGQMGTRSFENFFQAFETAVSREEALVKAASRFGEKKIEGPVKIADEALSDLLGHNSKEGLSSVTLSTPQSRLLARQQQREAASAVSDDAQFTVVKKGGAQGGASTLQAKGGAAGAFGISTDSISDLGKGAFSAAFLLKNQDGDQSAVIVPLQRSEALTKESFGSGELSAALARTEMPHVSKPTEFVFAVSVPLDYQLTHETSESKNLALGGAYSQAFRVPAENVRQFFDETQKLVPPGAPQPSISIAAVRMPAGPSTTLRRVMEAGQLSANEFGSFASGFFQGVNEMNSGGLLHHDLKAENVVFDRTTGRVMVIDMGGAVPMGEDGLTRTLNARNPFSTPPAIRTEADGLPTAHGPEFDRYSYAVTLLTALSKDIESSAAPDAFREAFGGGAGGGAPMERLLKALGDPDLPLTGAARNDIDARSKLSNVKAQLEDALARLPGTREILDQAFRAGLATGDESNKAWAELGIMLNRPAIPD